MAIQGPGSLREQPVPESSVRGARSAALGRRRLPPASNDNRPSVLRLLKITAAPLVLALVAAAVYLR